MISRDCGDDVDRNCLESCLPLDLNVASDQPDEAVQRVGGLSSGKSRFRKGGCQGGGISLLVTLFGEGSGCPSELEGGSAILAGSALIPGGQPQGGRHAGCRTLAPARARAEDDLYPLLAAAV